MEEVVLADADILGQINPMRQPLIQHSVHHGIQLALLRPNRAVGSGPRCRVAHRESVAKRGSTAAPHVGLPLEAPHIVAIRLALRSQHYFILAAVDPHIQHHCLGLDMRP